MPHLRQGIGQGVADSDPYHIDIPFSGFHFLPGIAVNVNQIQLLIAQRCAFALDLEWSMGIEYLAGVAKSLEFATIAGTDLSFYSGRAHVHGTLDLSRQCHHGGLYIPAACAGDRKHLGIY
jgi:hypothetical protein